MHVSRPAPDVVALSDAAEIPGLGFLPVNAYVLQAAQPMLIDTGLSASRGNFLDALWSVVDPADLRWIYLTHPDRDHTGSLAEVLVAAPSARLVTTFIGLGVASIDFEIPLDRVFLLNPGQALDLGDRRLTAFRPPVFDNPATTGSTTRAPAPASPRTASARRWRAPRWSRQRTSPICRPTTCWPASGSGRRSTARG